MEKEITKDGIELAKNNVIKILIASGGYEIDLSESEVKDVNTVVAAFVKLQEQSAAKNAEIEKLNTIIDELREQKVELQDTLTASKAELTELLLKIDFLTQELSCKSDGSNIGNDYRIELHE